MRIRDIKISDYNEIDKLMQQVHNLHVKNRPDLYIDLEHPYTITEFEELIEADNIISVLAEYGKNTLGLCIVTIKNKSGMVDKKVAYMEDLCIDEKFRGRGIGKKLVEYVSNIAKEKGAERLDLMVWAFNSNAINFYEELGMKPQRYIFEKEL